MCVARRYGNFVARLTSGDSFGEEALLTYPDVQDRNATVVSLGDLVLAELSMVDFAKILAVRLWRGMGRVGCFRVYVPCSVVSYAYIMVVWL